VHRHWPKDPALRSEHHHVVRPAEASRALGHGLHNRLEISRRARDHPQNVGRGRLLLQRLFRLVEQADVLDGDHRLIGERLQERDLLV
jgi:hypothetical protein